MNKKAALILIALAIAGVSYWLFMRSAPIKNFPPQNSTVVAFGDSLVYGTGSTKGNDFVSLVSTAIKHPVLNLGVPGNTTAQGLARLDDVIALDPGVVIILLGGNDALRRVPRETTFSNVRAIIEGLQSRGILVVLLGVRGGLIFDSFDDEYEAIAEEMGVVYVPDVLDGLFSNKEFMSDAVHPNDAGYKKIAERVAPVISRLLK